jgi:hypothetical protein
VLACAVAGDATGSVTPFTSKAAFDAATAGLANVAVLDFDGVAAGTLIASDTSLDPIGFSYAITGGAQLVVIDDFATTSGTNSLGITGDLSFLAGDAFSMTFPPATAVGLFVIGEDMLPGDVALQTAAGDVANDVPDAVLVDGSSVYFLGLVESDPALAITAATLASSVAEDVGDYVWNVDDVRLAPEPAAALGGLVALLALASRAPRLRT